MTWNYFSMVKIYKFFKCVYKNENQESNAASKLHIMPDIKKWYAICPTLVLRQLPTLSLFRLAVDFCSQLFAILITEHRSSFLTGCSGAKVNFYAAPGFLLRSSSGHGHWSDAQVNK